MAADQQPMLDEEAGASDNRLSLSVGDNPAVKDWEDGKQYKVSMTVRQQTPGEFIVVGAVEGEPADSEEGEKPEAPAPDGTSNPGATGNPAVDKLMAQQAA